MKKNSKIVIISKQLHSCFASYSSNDEYVYLETVKSKVKFEIYEGETIKTNNKAFECLNGEKIAENSENNKILKVYLEPDKKYYHTSRAMDNATKEQMAALVKTYTDKGWSSEKPEILTILYQQERQIETMHRENHGFVIPEWSKDFTSEQYQGGLSKELVSVPVLKLYMSSGGCHGYIGHSQRTYEIDRFLESFLLRKGYKLEIIAEFLTWRQGRHFADQLDGERFEDSKTMIRNEAIGYIESVVKSMEKETV